MRLFRLTGCALVLFPLLLVGGWILVGAIQYRTSSTQVVLRKMQTLSDLVVLRVAVQFTNQQSIGGRLGGINCLMEVCGEADLGIDLTEAQLTEVDPVTRTAKLQLPPARVTGAHVDLEATRIYQLNRSGLWQIVPGDAGERHLVERALSQAERLVRQAGQESDQLQLADQRARELCSELAAGLGWTLH